jgi:hypothetical protein
MRPAAENNSSARSCGRVFFHDSKPRAAASTASSLLHGGFREAADDFPGSRRVGALEGFAGADLAPADPQRVRAAQQASHFVEGFLESRRIVGPAEVGQRLVLELGRHARVLLGRWTIESRGSLGERPPRFRAAILGAVANEVKTRVGAPHAVLARTRSRCEAARAGTAFAPPGGSRCADVSRKVLLVECACSRDAACYLASTSRRTCSTFPDRRRAK